MTKNYKEIDLCEVCNSLELESVLNLGTHPMCDDLIPINHNNVCNEYPIEILYCKTCKTAHQKFQVNKESLFPIEYHYRARFTKDVIEGMKNLVRSCIPFFKNKKNLFVLDIGCNDGSLLNFFRNEGFKTIGIEPTGAHQDAIENGHEVYNEYFSSEVAKKILKDHGNPDLITFTNVFAHIDDLKEVIRSLNILLNEKTILVIENHYLGSVLDKNQFDTFYHEHPRTYSLSSFKYIASALGSKIILNEFPSRYGGNIRVFISKEGEESVTLENDLLKEKKFPNQFTKLNKDIDIWLKKKTLLIKELIKTNGKICAKAFPGRAAILIKMLKLTEDHISEVFEKPGSLKINHYLPGTRIPINSDDKLFNEIHQIKVILNLAWHIPEEIKNYLEKNSFTGKIINIIEPDDFS